VTCPGDLARAAGFTTTAGRCAAQTADAVRAQAKVPPPFQSVFLIWVAQR
jgi:hypothetical protein